MLAQQEETQRFGLTLFQNIPDGFKIPQRFRHLFGIYLHKAVMHPVIGEFLAEGGFALGNFVFMMGKNQILPASVNVQRQRKIFFAHGGTFYMPAGAALPPGAVQEGSPGLAAFHSAKSSGSSFSSPGATRAPERRSSTSRPESLP